MWRSVENGAGPDNNEMYKPLKLVIDWRQKGGVPNTPKIEVVYEEALQLAELMHADVNQFYQGCVDPSNQGHSQVALPSFGLLIVHTFWNRDTCG